MRADSVPQASKNSRLITGTDVQKADFITGKKNLEKDFDDYIAELDSMNLSEVVEVKQTQYNRYLKALGK